MRRFLVLALCMAGGCGSLLGIEPGSPEPDPSDGAAAINDGARTDASNDVLVAEDSDGGAPTDAPPSGIDCLGAQRDAFFCDGFESPTLAAAWFPILVGDGATFAPSTKHFLQGTHGGLSRFSPMPANGIARIAWKRPGGSGPTAFQFAVFVASDAWSPGQDVPIGGLRGGSSSALVYFLPNGNDANGSLEVRFQTPGSPAAVTLGAAKLNGWQCIELVHDGANLTAYLGSDAKGSAPVSVAFDTVEVGFDWPYTGNPNAAKEFSYDNVAIGPARLGCITN
jgi:hypothetical protein